MANDDVYNFTLISGLDLPIDIRDDVIRTLLSNESFADYTQSAARQIFRDAGFRFRDSVFNNIFNDVIGIDRVARRIGTLGFTDIPNDNHFAIARYELPQNYRYTIRYDYLDQTTNEEVFSFMTYDSNRRLMIGDVLDFAETHITANYLEGLESYTDIKVIRGYRNRQ